MTDVAQRNPLSEMLRGIAHYPLPSNDHLKGLRAAAMERANSLTVPSLRDEDWRFTDLTPLFKSVFQPAPAGAAVASAQLARFEIQQARVQLVYVDGHFSPTLSRIEDFPSGVEIGNMNDRLGSIASFRDDAFVALNTSFIRDVASIQVGRDVDCATPIHVMFVTTQADRVSYPRLYISAASGARLTVIEDHLSITDGSTLVNAVTEVDVQANAYVRHVKLQRQGSTQYHLGHFSAQLARDAQLASHSMTLGARLSRNSLQITQLGQGASCSIDGLALLNGRQHADTHSTMDHAQPNGQSDQIHRCIVDGTARAVFNGKIFVREGAQLTQASQQSRNLLLSARARVDTKPQLEIYADDVKCAHGATVGQLEAEEVFYLRSRGLSEKAARSLLTYAFAAEMVERIPVTSLVDQLRKEIMRHSNVGVVL